MILYNSTTIASFIILKEAMLKQAYVTKKPCVVIDTTFLITNVRQLFKVSVPWRQCYCLNISTSVPVISLEQQYVNHFVVHLLKTGSI